MAEGEAVGGDPYRSGYEKIETIIVTTGNEVAGQEIVAYPESCRMTEVREAGIIRCDGWKVYSSHALAGYQVGLQAVERGYRVWFFHVLLGTFELGVHETLEPATAASG